MSADRDKISTGAQQAASVCIYSLRHGTSYKYRNNSRPLALTFPALPPSGPICDASGRLEGAAVWHNEARQPSEDGLREEKCFQGMSWCVTEEIMKAKVSRWNLSLSGNNAVPHHACVSCADHIFSDVDCEELNYYYASKSETCFSLLVVGSDAEGWSVTDRAGRFIRLSLWQQFMQCKTFWRLVLYESS